jgi:hypothetical protein
VLAPSEPFAQTIAAWRKLRDATGDRWQWLFALGDALNKEAPLGRHGVHNGAGDKLHDALKALRDERCDFTFRYLELIRSTAAHFPDPDRRRLRAFSFNTLIAAGDPDTLDAAVKAAGDKRVTKKFVDHFKKARANQQRRKRAEQERRDRDDLKDRTAPDLACEKSLANYVTKFHDASTAHDEIQPYRDRLTAAQRAQMEKARSALYERIREAAK